MFNELLHKYTAATADGVGSCAVQMANKIAIKKLPTASITLLGSGIMHWSKDKQIDVIQGTGPFSCTYACSWQRHPPPLPPPPAAPALPTAQLAQLVLIHACIASFLTCFGPCNIMHLIAMHNFWHKAMLHCKHHSYCYLQALLHWAVATFDLRLMWPM